MQSHPFSRRAFARRSNMRCLLLVFLAMGMALAASRETLSAEKKIRNIEGNRWPASRSISFSSQELLALAMQNANSAYPGVLSNPQLALIAGGATAMATVNFDRLRELSPGRDSSRDWIMAKLLTGRHPVSVSVVTSSSNGQMTVRPTSVAVAGITVSGSALDLLLRNFVLTHYPDAVIDRPFALAQNIDRIDVKPGAAVVVAK